MTNEIFEKIFNHVIMIEGGYSNDPKDSGGATRYGITEAVARANRYTGAMQSLPIDTAKEIYKSQYWDTLKLDEVSKLSELIAAEMFDTAVNMGVGVAGKFLQRALNGLNNQQEIYADLQVDGVIGPMTIDCLLKFLLKRASNGETVLVRALNGFQLCRYYEIVEARQKDEAFLYGWILQRVK